jgi:hypothetical protein
MPLPNTVPYRVRLLPGQMKTLKAIAAAEDRSLTRQLEHLLKLWLKEHAEKAGTTA